MLSYGNQDKVFEPTVRSVNEKLAILLNLHRISMVDANFVTSLLSLHLSCFILRSFSPYSLCAFTATAAAFAAIAIECGVAEMDVLCGAAAEGRESVRGGQKVFCGRGRTREL